MSFKCQSCGKSQPAGTKEAKVVTEVRAVTYPETKDKFGKPFIPEGYEIAKELRICPDCLNKNFQTVVVGSKVIK
jgi:hypothetical protein